MNKKYNDLELEIISASKASEKLADKFRKRAEEVNYSIGHTVDCEKGGHPRIIITATYAARFRELYGENNELGTLYEQFRIKEVIPKIFEYSGKTFPVEVQILSNKHYGI